MRFLIVELINSGKRFIKTLDIRVIIFKLYDNFKEIKEKIERRIENIVY